MAAAQLAAYSLRRPVRVTADGSIRTDEAQGSLNSVRVPTTLLQEFVRIRREHEGDREAVLLALCTRTFRSKCIVFAREKRRAHRLRILFGLFGLKVQELHGACPPARCNTPRVSLARWLWRCCLRACDSVRSLSPCRTRACTSARGEAHALAHARGGEHVHFRRRAHAQGWSHMSMHMGVQHDM